VKSAKIFAQFIGATLAISLLGQLPVYATNLSELEARYDQLRQSHESDTYLVNVTLRGYESESAQCYLRYVNATDPLEIQQRNNCKAAFDSTQQSIFDVTRRAAGTLTEMQSLRVQIEALKAIAPTPTPTPSPTPTPTPTTSPTSQPVSTTIEQSSNVSSELSVLEARYDQLRQSHESDTYLVNVTLRGYEADSGQCYLRYVNATDPLEIQQRNNCKAAFDSTQQSIFDVTRRAAGTLTEMQSLRVQIESLKAASSNPSPSPSPSPTLTPAVSPLSNTTAQPVTTTTAPLTKEAESVTTTPSAETPRLTTQVTQKSNNFSVLTSTINQSSSFIQFASNLEKKLVRVIATKKGAKTIRLSIRPDSKRVITIRTKANLTGYTLEFLQGTKVINRHYVTG